MNAFANNQHEEDVCGIIQHKIQEAYLTVSNRLLPSIRFYDRVSTTVLNSYVGPTLKRYLSALISKLLQRRCDIS
jgi:N-methylhydantoinase A